MDTFKPAAEISKALKTHLDIAAAKATNREIALKLAELGVPSIPCREIEGRGRKGEILKIKALRW